MLGVDTLYIDPASPWENGYLESFNGKLRDELLNIEILDAFLEVQVLVDRWRNHYNSQRPHSSLANLTPAEFAGRSAASQPLGDGQGVLEPPAQTYQPDEELCLAQ